MIQFLRCELTIQSNAATLAHARDRAADETLLRGEDDLTLPSLRVLKHDFRRHVASLPHFQVMDLNLNSVLPQMKTSLSTSSCWVTRREFTSTPFCDPRSIRMKPFAFMRISQ